jgi:hypothetical protein
MRVRAEEVQVTYPGGYMRVRLKSIELKPTAFDASPYEIIFQLRTLGVVDADEFRRLERATHDGQDLEVHIGRVVPPLEPYRPIDQVESRILEEVNRDLRTPLSDQYNPEFDDLADWTLALEPWERYPDYSQ